MFVLLVPGDLTPHLGYPLVGVFLQGTKDPDPSIRASSLSNLGALCQGLDYSLGPLAPEVRRLPASQATFVSRNAQQVAMFGEGTSCLRGDVFRPLNGGLTEVCWFRPSGCLNSPITISSKHTWTDLRVPGDRRTLRCVL